MAQYIEFLSRDHEGILVEVDDRELPSGIAKTGLREIAAAGMTQAQEILHTAIMKVLRINGSAFYDAISALSPAPAEAEISFGIKLTGEIGNVAITKVSSEGNYSVKLVWKLDKETNPA